MYYLIHKLANRKIIKYELKEGDTVIGRDLGSDVVLNEKSISRKHCRISCIGRDLHIVDLNSTNGTFINEQKIQDSALNAGDMLRLGKVALTLERDSMDDDSPPDILNRQLLKKNPIVEKEEDAGAAIQPPIATGADIQNHTLLDQTRQVTKLLAEINEARDLERLDQNNLKALKNTIIHFNILFEISQKINTTMDLDEVLSTTLDIIFTALPAAQHGFVILLDERGEKVPVAVKGRIPDSIEDQRIVLSRSIINRVLNLKEGILSNDVLGDDNLSISESVRSLEIKSILCAPLVVRGTAIGLLLIDCRSTTGAFQEDDLNLLLAIANMVASYIDSSLLFKKMNSRIKLSSKDVENKNRMLLKYNERMRAVVNTLSESVIVIDTKGQVVLCNEAAMSLFDTGLISMDFVEAIKNENILKLYEDATREGAAKSQVLTLSSPQGEKSVEATISPMSTFEEIIGFVCSITDISRFQK